MKKLVINVETGESALVDLSAEEIAEIEVYVRPVPEQVTLYQGRVALRRAGMFAAVKAMAERPGNEDAFEAFEYADPWYRSSGWIASLGSAFGLTGGQIDDLFRAAAEIE